MSTSSSSSSPSLSRRWPPGRGFVERTRGILRAPGGGGLIVSRDDPGPRSRSCDFGLGGGEGALAVASGGNLFAIGCLAATLSPPAAWPRPSVARAFGGGRAVRDFPGLRLEELTPDLPDAADRVREGPKGHHGSRSPRGGGLDDRGVLGLRHALGVDPDDAVVNSAFENDQRPHAGITLQATGGRYLQPADRDNVAAHKPGDRDPRALDVGLHVGFRPDEELSVAIHLAAAMAQDLAAALDLQPDRDCVVARQHRRL